MVYITLFRFALVPRLLAGFGIACVLIQMSGLMMPFFGYRVNFYMLAPVGLCLLVLVIWLLAKGFADNSDNTVSESALTQRW